MLVFFGDCEKHDFVLATAVALSAVRQQKVTVVTDNMRNYKYFDGEVSGVAVSEFNDIEDPGLAIYDCHKVILPDLSMEKVVLFTDFSKHSIDMIRSVYGKIGAEALLVIEQDSAVSMKYIDTCLGAGMPVYSYEEGTRRKVDMVFNGKVRFKDFDEGFLKTLGKFLISHCEVSAKDIRSLWNFLRKRG